MTDLTTVDLVEFTCPECDRTTHNPHDVKSRYCQWCHWWTGDPVMAGVQRDASFDEDRVTCIELPTSGTRVVRGVARVASPVDARCAAPSF